MKKRISWEKNSLWKTFWEIKERNQGWKTRNHNKDLTHILWNTTITTIIIHMLRVQQQVPWWNITNMDQRCSSRIDLTNTEKYYFQVKWYVCFYCVKLSIIREYLAWNRLMLIHEDFLLFLFLENLDLSKQLEIILSYHPFMIQGGLKRLLFDLFLGFIGLIKVLWVMFQELLLLVCLLSEIEEWFCKDRDQGSSEKVREWQLRWKRWIEE